MAVPNTNTFSLQDVVNEINPSSDDLATCFAEANPNYFNPAYSGTKDRLTNFRDYGSHNANTDPVTTFQCAHDPLDGQIDIVVETRDYTGIIYVRFLDSNGSTIIHSGTFIVSSSGVEYTFNTPDINFIDGNTYVAKLWLDSVASGTFDAETSFATFGIAGL